MKQLKGTKKKQGTAEENHEFKKKIIIIPYSRYFSLILGG